MEVTERGAAWKHEHVSSSGVHCCTWQVLVNPSVPIPTLTKTLWCKWIPADCFWQRILISILETTCKEKGINGRTGLSYGLFYLVFFFLVVFNLYLKVHLWFPEILLINISFTFFFVWQVHSSENTVSHMILVPKFDWTGTWKSDFVKVDDDSAGWKMIKSLPNTGKLLSVLEKSSWHIRRFFFVSTTYNNHLFK